MVFNNGVKSRTITIPEADTPLADTLRTTILYGEGTAQATGKEMKITSPSQSVSIFSLD